MPNSHNISLKRTAVEAAVIVGSILMAATRRGSWSQVFGGAMGR